MGKWGPQGKTAALSFSFDNMGEASDVEYGRWPADQRLGFHRGVYETLPFLLDVMKEYGLKATFFIEAWNVDYYPAAIRAITADGHEIASHAYRHETWYLQDEARKADIHQSVQALYASLGIAPLGFRPPGGITTAESEAVQRSLGHRYVSPNGGIAGTRDGIAVIPADMRGTDVSYYRSEAFGHYRHPRITATDEAAAFVEGYGYLMEDIVATGDCRSPISHVTTPLDTTARRDAFRRIVEMTIAEDRLWVAPMYEVADWMLAHENDFPTVAVRGFEPDWDPRVSGPFSRGKAHEKATEGVDA